MASTAHISQQDPRLLASSPEVSAWVSANAGAGKTHLLVSRVLRLLLSGTEPSRILCVTYTRSAAAEMRGRILDALSQWVMLDDATLDARLEKLCGVAPNAQVHARARSLFALLADAPEGLRIDTLHAFCQSLLRRFPLEAGVAPYFSVIDERTSQELLFEAAMRLFSGSVEGENALREAVRTLAAFMSEYAFHELLRGIAGNRRRLQEVLAGGREAAVRRMCALLKVSAQESEASLLQEAFHYTAAEMALLQVCARKLCASAKAVDQATGAVLRKWLEGSSRMHLHAEYVGHYHTREGEMCAAKSLFTKEANLSAAEQEALLAEQARVHAFDLRCRAVRIARLSTHLLTVAEALLSGYGALKDARAVADYDDLVRAATRLLSQEGIAPWVMYKLDEGIDHILIDEAQDTSREQWDIAYALSQEFFAGVGRSETTRTLFAVGDVKQSIFRFQGADPELFISRQALYAKYIPDSGNQWEVVELPESFRSVQPVLQAVDAVFADEGVHHTLTRHGHGGCVEVWPLIAQKEGGGARQLAAHIAGTIKQWLSSGEMLESQGRPIAPGDIILLLRTRGALAGALLQALRQAGVPVAGADRLALHNSLAVQDLLALGQFLLLPQDDLSLAALLKSPLFAVSEEELFALAHGRGEERLWERVRGHKAAEALSALLAMVDFSAPYELFAYVLDAQDGRARFAARMGEAVHEVLDEFLAQALAYEQSHTPSLQGFLHWMTMGEVEIRRDMEQGGNAVRIMTAHAAKGLQAPIVILPDTGPLNTPFSRLLWHEAADGCLLWNPSNANATAEIQALKQAQADEETKEYRRLLYVAMTRAQDRLYVCGVEPGRGSATESWHQRVWRTMEGITQKVDTPAGVGLRLISPQEKQVERAASVTAGTTLPMPEALLRPAPEETATRPLSPSRLFEGGEASPAFSPATQEMLFARGALIHRLLQYLPSAPAHARRGAGVKLLAHHHIPEKEHEALLKEVLGLIEAPEFAAFFGPDSLAEVPLSGMVRINGKMLPIAGQVDRMALTKDEIWVLDYKTQSTPPASIAAVPVRYLRQMAAYRALLTEIYPHRRVRCALLWTAGPKLMELSEGPLTRP